jgi:hypothetical protein
VLWLCLAVGWELGAPSWLALLIIERLMGAAAPAYGLDAEESMRLPH